MLRQRRASRWGLVVAVVIGALVSGVQPWSVTVAAPARAAAATAHRVVVAGHGAGHAIVSHVRHVPATAAVALGPQSAAAVVLIALGLAGVRRRAARPVAVAAAEARGPPRRR